MRERAARRAGRPEGHRLALLGYPVALAGACVAFGTDPVLGWLAGALNVVFAVYFFRHLAFAVSAARWAGSDLVAADVDLDGYEPKVAVFVGCKNEELVVDGMVTALLGLDYPADRLTIVVVDDGSDDRTGELLDARAADDSRAGILRRW